MVIKLVFNAAPADTYTSHCVPTYTKHYLSFIQRDQFDPPSLRHLRQQASYELTNCFPLLFACGVSDRGAGFVQLQELNEGSVEVRPLPIDPFPGDPFLAKDVNRDLLEVPPF
jgi:hypothetical protein